MATTCVFDLATPRRPTLNDVGGAAKENDPVLPPPDPITMLEADQVNQWALLCQRLGGVVPLLVAFFTQSAGVYTCTLVLSPVASLHQSQGTFPFTKVATGRITVGTNLNTLLPSTSQNPFGMLNTGTTHLATVDASRISANYVGATNGGTIGVTIDNGAGTLTDKGFAVCLW